MSTAEPVSAFGAFKASKQLSEHKKKSKKQQSKAHNGTTATKQKLNTSAVTKADKAATIFGDNLHAKTKSTTQSKSKKGTHQKPQSAKRAGAKKQSHKFKEHEVVPLVEQLMGDSPKILSKAQQKKKQELEEYLVDQLERGNRSDSEEGENDDFESEASEEETYNEFSDEYTINRSTSYSEDVSGEEEASEEEDSYDQEHSFSAEEESVTSLNKNKRKLSDATNNQSSAVVKANGISEAKKSKNSDAKVQNKNAAKTIATEAKGRKSVGQEKSSGSRKASITTVSVKLEPLSPPHNIIKVNSIEEGKRAFQWLINPVKADEFFGKYWESKACLVKRKQGSYFSHLISCEAIDQMLLKNHVEFTKNLDVTSYKNGIRETLNPEGRAMPPVVWSHYSDGCSIRLLNPQTFLPNLYSLSATLQEFFHCLVGANAYLTPPNSQGFAPHYDDIEAFVLQIEGRKRWKLYKPRVAADVLPRYSSKNFSQAEIGKPILEEVLEPGDVLYFPRGTIHQACTEPGYHSLHITLSVYQKQSYADLFEKMMPLLVQKAIASSVEMRRGLPLHCFQNAGLAFSDSSSKERSDLQKKVSQLLHKCVKDLPINDILDAAVDQVAKKFQHEALPPEVLPSEKIRTVFGAHNRIDARGECVYDYEIDERTNVRLLRANILRLVEEEEKLRIYYYLDNSKEYCEYEPNFIEIEALEAASVEVLIKSYPAYVGVSQLPLPDDEQKINLVTALWERGLLMMEKPFK